MPRKIGLTGGMGSGKSTVAKMFEILGVPVYSADAATKRLYHTNEDLIQKLKEHFGDDIYNQSELDRAKLAKMIFTNPENLDWLNNLVHPLTAADARRWMDLQSTPYVVKESALLFEAGAADGLDLIIGVYTPQHRRIRRVMERDHLKREEVLERMNRQIAEEIKMKLCDVVLLNDEQDLLVPRIIALHQKLLQPNNELR